MGVGVGSAVWANRRRCETKACYGSGGGGGGGGGVSLSRDPDSFPVPIVCLTQPAQKYLQQLVKVEV